MLKNLFFSVSISSVLLLVSFVHADMKNHDEGLSFDYEKNLSDFFKDADSEELQKKLLGNQSQLKEFILDFYSDLGIAQDAYKEGYADTESFKRKVSFFKKKLLIEEIMKDAEKNIEYPDFSELAKERYDANIKDYTIREKRKVAHILVDEEKKEKDCSCKNEPEWISYKDLIKKIKDGEDFAELAKKYSIDKGTAVSGGVLPTYVDGSGSYITVFENASYDIKEIGDISRPVKSKFGIHIIKLLETVPSEIIPFEKVKDGIVKTLKEEYKATVLGKIRSDNYPDLDKLDLKQIESLIKSSDSK